MVRKCPDCKAGMGAIQLLDRVGDHGRRQERGLAYAAVDSASNAWTGGFEIQGTIEALVCKKCRRVVFYALPDGE